MTPTPFPPPGARSAPGALAVLLALALACTLPGIAASHPDWISADEVRTGDRGVVRTVLQGRETVEIEVEILGRIEHGIGPGIPMILGRFVDESGRWTGVAAGMSGSPVWIGDRLLGAVSYSIGAFTKEPICGITPIEAMAALEELPAGRAAVEGRLAPAPLALVGAGFVPEALANLEQLLAARGLPVTVASIPATAGSAPAESPAQAPAMRPGEPVAALLVWGDLVLGATGTITWRDGDELLAFGHPFLGAGKLALPLAPAEIVWTVPSLFNSFKISRIGAPSGVVEQDRLTAIAGRLGAPPAGIPMTVRLERGGRTATLHEVHLARDRMLTPVLGAVALANVAARQASAERDEALRLDLRVRLADGRELVTEAAGANPGAAQQAFIEEVNRYLGWLISAPHELPAITSLEARVRATEPAGGLEIVRAMPDRLVARPGETVNVTVDLEGPRGLARRVALPVDIPGSTRPGRYVLFIGASRAVDGKFGNPGEARRRSAGTADDYLDALEARAPVTVLEARLALPAEGIIARGSAFPALPGTAHLLLRSRPGGERRMYRARYLEIARTAREIGRPVDRVVAVPLRVSGPFVRSDEAPGIDEETSE
ncbi:MAG: SpoIVB peptidase S55 domain-containing protein [Acidobacteriota bacterium]